jgi:hypothetical protein
MSTLRSDIDSGPRSPSAKEGRITPTRWKMVFGRSLLLVGGLSLSAAFGCNKVNQYVPPPQVDVATPLTD